jgi:hypothetical protein
MNAAAASVLAIGMAATGSVAMAGETSPAQQTPALSASTHIVATPVAVTAASPAAITNNAAPAHTATAPQTSVSAWDVSADPYFSPALIAAFALIYAAGCAMAAKRGVRGAWLRAAAGAALVAGLVNPEVTHEIRKPFATTVAVVVDDSASQALDNRDKATTAEYNDIMQQMAKMPGLDVRTITAGARENGTAVDGSNLFGALNGGLLDVPPDRLGAVIMLTDGQVHDVPHQYNEADSGAPLHVLLSGHAGETDRRIVADSTPLYGIVGKDLTIKFHVVDNGNAGDNGKPVQVTVKIDGAPVTTQSVMEGQPASVTIKIPHGGANAIELTADALPHELTPLNNSFAASVMGVRDHLRVLLVSGEPNSDERTWRNLLKADPMTDLVHFTILRPPFKADDTPPTELSLVATPTRQLFSEKLKDFDLVIFDHYQNRRLLPSTYFDNIVNYVRNGGALLIANGPEYAGRGSLYNTSLKDILPAVPSGDVTDQVFFPRLTEQGERHPITRDLSGANPTPDSDPQWGAWTRQIDTSKTSGETIMSGANGEPLLVISHEGKGRVAEIMSDSAWLWARGIDGGGPYADLLQRTTHWLMKESSLEEEALRLSAEKGELTIERQTMGNTAAPVTIRTPSGKTQTVELKKAAPGLWRATIPADEMGLYSAVEDDQKAFANIGTSTPKEFANTLSTPDLLKPIVDATHGGIIRMTGQTPPYTVQFPTIRAVHAGDAMAGPDWLGIRMTDAYAMESSTKVSLLSGWLGFTLLMGGLAAAWYRDGDGAWFRKENWGRKNQGSGKPPEPPKP